MPFASGSSEHKAGTMMMMRSEEGRKEACEGRDIFVARRMVLTIDTDLPLWMRGYQAQDAIPGYVRGSLHGLCSREPDCCMFTFNELEQ